MGRAKMFESYFQLQRRPFSSVPSTEQYFAAATIESTRVSLVRLIERQSGPGLVVGAIGTGKSLLCELIAESFRHRCRTIILPSGRLCTRRSLLQVILYGLGLPYRELEEGELRLSLIDHVTNKDVCPNGLLLLVDEADNLPMTLLDELRSMTNLCCEGEPCVQMALFGTPRLEEKFTHPRLDSFNQRIAGRFYLDSFTSDETAQYVTQLFDECGGNANEVFSEGALQAIHSATEGIPRLINQLADHALIMATANSIRHIEGQDVEEAWADLQQLPFPAPTHGISDDLPADIVEFGQLEDMTDAVGQAESALDEIEAQMDLVSDEAVEAEFVTHTNVASQEPPSDNPPDEPEVTLYFHEAHDPFGNDFEEEEVVIDHFLSPDALSQRHCRQVRDANSDTLAAQLDDAMSEAHHETHDEQASADSNHELNNAQDDHGQFFRDDRPITIQIPLPGADIDWKTTDQDSETTEQLHSQSDEVDFDPEDSTFERADSEYNEAPSNEELPNEEHTSEETATDEPFASEESPYDESLQEESADVQSVPNEFAQTEPVGTEELIALQDLENSTVQSAFLPVDTVENVAIESAPADFDANPIVTESAIPTDELVDDPHTEYRDEQLDATDDFGSTEPEDASVVAATTESPASVATDEPSQENSNVRHDYRRLFSKIRTRRG